MPTTAEIQRLFLSSPRYAVVGASKDQSKYGTKVGSMHDVTIRLVAHVMQVLKWYIARKKEVTPIHPVNTIQAKAMFVL